MGTLETSWRSTDPLGATLHHLRMSSVLYCQSALSGSWGVALPPMPDCLMFHIVIDGACQLRIGADSWPLQTGSFALVPHGVGHVIASDVEAPVCDLLSCARERISEHFEHLQHGTDGTPCTMLCGAVRMEDPVARRLARLLPPCLHSDTRDQPDAEWMRQTMDLLIREASGLRPGGEVVLTRLADVLVIQSIRDWLMSEPAAGRGWLAALQDPELGPVLAAIHAEPERSWTVASLAQVAAMSRSVFAARFAEVLGQTPADYVRHWKMHLAATWLQAGEAGVLQASQRLGYESEAAFSRAFKRVMGCPPGGVRKR